MNINQILERVNKALEEPVSELEIQKAMILVRHELSEPKWAIEDEKLRDEMEKLLVQMVVKNYMEARSPDTKKEVSDERHYTHPLQGLYYQA